MPYSNLRFIVKEKDQAKCKLTSLYGTRIHPVHGYKDGHRAVDIGMPIGTELIAPTDGKIYINAVNNGGSSKGYGYYVVLALDNGDFVLYAHLKALSHLKIGTRFKAGEVVAISGNTGTSTGPHVHFEYHSKGFLFRTQTTATKDTAIDPVTVYPQLKGMKGKSLAGLKFYQGGLIMDKETKEEIRGIVREEIINYFKDLDKLEKEKFNSTSWEDAIENGEVDGKRPRAYATRQEVVELISRALKNIFDK